MRQERVQRVSLQCLRDVALGYWLIPKVYLATGEGKRACNSVNGKNQVGNSSTPEIASTANYRDGIE